MQSPSADLRDQINKRMTLNLLIQGAATHTFLTSHYVVKEELDALHPKLVALYDKVAVSAVLSFWYGDLVLLFGRPERFWRGTDRPTHPFHDHPLLAEIGGELAAATKGHAIARARDKGVAIVPLVHYGQLLGLIVKATMREFQLRAPLERLAKLAAHRIWGIDEDRLDASQSRQVEFGNVRPPATFVGRLCRHAAAGWGGVVREGDQLKVVARAWLWPLLSHELVKGTAELVCLHGLNTLDRATYDAVTSAADKIEYECWQMQAGAELWRRFLAAAPSDRPLAEALMQVARLDPKALERLMLAVAKRTREAQFELAAL